MRICTLGFLFKEGKIILAKKKRKIGVGKWNGYGGKVEEGEDMVASLVREFKEESDLDIDANACIPLGYMDFHFQDTDSSPLRAYVYRIDDFDGHPKETEEMGEPKEFKLDEIPYDEMMVGDDKFMPYVVNSKSFTGEIYFSNNGDELKSFKIQEIN